MAAFLAAGLLAYVIIPGMLVIWDGYLTTWTDANTGKIRTANVNRTGRGIHPLPSLILRVYR